MQGRGHEVFGISTSESAQAHAVDTIPEAELEERWEVVVLWLKMADLIACELTTHHAVARRLAAAAAELPDQGRARVFVGISNPLVWAQTPSLQAPIFTPTPELASVVEEADVGPFAGAYSERTPRNR